MPPRSDPTASEALRHIQCDACCRRGTKACRQCRRPDPRANARQVIEQIEKTL
jgi:hypothetical protein